MLGLIMTEVIKSLMTLLNIDEEEADRVEREMCIWGLDFSECTQREFNRVARECHHIVKGYR